MFSDNNKISAGEATYGGLQIWENNMEKWKIIWENNM